MKRDSFESPPVRLVPGVTRVYEVLFIVVVVSSCERLMIVIFESQNVTNVQQRVTISVRDRNECRSICHFCFRGCVYHYAKSAPKKSGVSF